MSWDKRIKPPADFCPGKYCFMWVPPGGSADMSGQTYSSIEDALTKREGWVDFPKGGCSCTRGICTRFDPIAGDRDMYEPNEPALEHDGLPWFYFIPSVDNLAADFHEEYLRESRELWGDETEAG